MEVNKNKQVINGQCLCGAVQVSAVAADDEMTVCHCETCRKQTSGMLFAFGADTDQLDISGPYRVYTSSDWAERGFCPNCGTFLFYRVTMDGPYSGVVKLSVGLFEQTPELALGTEFFVDNQPTQYALHGAKKSLTKAEVMARFSNAESGEPK